MPCRGEGDGLLAPGAAGNILAVPSPALLSYLIMYIARMSAAVRAVVLFLVVIFTQKRLLLGEETGAAYLTLQFPGVGVDESRGSVSHGFPVPPRIQLSEKGGFPRRNARLAKSRTRILSFRFWFFYRLSLISAKRRTIYYNSFKNFNAVVTFPDAPGGL
jgi:hypothetical protein